MTKREILNTRISEMLDMMACRQIMAGNATEKHKYYLNDIINM